MRSIHFKILLAVAVGAIAVPVALQSRVKDTPHKITGTNGIAVEHDEICRPCHAPHNTDKTMGFLWNHTTSTGPWTLNEGDAANLSNGSKACLSCHDGTVAIDSYGGKTGSVKMTGSSLLGTDLSNSHPIGVEYPTSSSRYNQPDASGNIKDPTETPAGQSAGLEDGRIQCGSCHRAHGSRASYGMFLRVDNTGSALCMTCHISPG